MATFVSKPFLQLLVIFILISKCSGARVEFYKEANFTGEVFITTSPPGLCINLPDTFKNVNGSLKTQECIAVYMFENCAWDGYLVKSDDDRLIELPAKYSSFKSQSYSVVSFRDCVALETIPQINFVYYEKEFFQGLFIPFQDVCGCTNLPHNLFKSDSGWRSITTFGNCFHRYSQPNCVGELNTGYEIHDSYFESTWQSIKPCHIPMHCKK